MVASRYLLLDQLHQLIKPRGYLEIGVQHGGSLALAQCDALGIDPAPLVVPGTVRDAARVQVAESDFFFQEIGSFRHMLPKVIDLAFIDGMHLAEFAMRDFMNIERLAHEKTVIVFDDVLPYSAEIATREQPPGDWTGDVWRVIDFLEMYRKDLRMLQVDTYPTGSLVVFQVDPMSNTLREHYDAIHRACVNTAPLVPSWVLNRERTVSMTDVLETLREWL